MSYTVQAAEPNASATVRGVMTTGPQTFAGAKTLVNKLTVQGQGALGTAGSTAIGLGTLDPIQWDNPSGSPTLLYGGNFAGQGMTRCTTGPFVTDSATGFCMGGVNSAFQSGGLFAASQSYQVDVYQGQATYGTQLYSAKGAAAGEVVVVGSGFATPHADAELLRIAYGLAGTISGPGTAVAKFFGDGRMTLTGGATANSYGSPGFSVISGNMSVGQITNGGLIVSASGAVQELSGQVTDGAGAVAVAISPFNAWTLGKLCAWRSSRNGTEKLAVRANGKLEWPTGAADAVVGRATLVGGTKTINTSAVKTGSEILLTRRVAAGAVGDLRIGAVVDGTSFVINSASGTDTSDVSWFIFN